MYGRRMSSFDMNMTQSIQDAANQADEALAHADVSSDAKAIAYAIREAGLRIQFALMKK